MRPRGLAFRGAFAAGAAALCAVLAGFGLGRGVQTESMALVLIAAVATAGVAIGYLALANPSRSLSAVRKAADRVAAGELGERATVRSAATDDLTDAFNTMSERVRDLVAGTGAEHARLEAVFDASTDPMIAISRDGVVRFLNPAALRLFGLAREGAVGRPFIESARDYELDALVRAAIAAQDDGKTTVVTFGPRRIPLRAGTVPISGGGDWAVLLMLTDLTDIQRLDAVRRDFLSNVSHELRTPLASIRAMVETLEDGGLDDRHDAEEFLKRIHQQVERLTTLVNELLELSRIESGAIDLQPEMIDVSGLVGEAASLMRPKAELEGVTILCPGRSGPTLEGDRTSLLRVVSNLLDNAIKFSPRGGTVNVETSEQGDLVAISVRDEGEGISAGDLPRVFERFYKGDQSRSKTGVGLGLAIVKHVVRAHGGTAEAESGPDAGATFTVRLPKVFVGQVRGAGAGQR